MKNFLLMMLLISTAACSSGTHMIKTNFHQNSPYNNLLDGNKTGCATISIAAVVDLFITYDNIPLLIKKIAIESKTMLGKKESSTFCMYIESTLDHFGIYSEEIDDDFYEKIKKQKTPSIVYIKMRDDDHCVIIDGYNENDGFHFNFGWGWGRNYWMKPDELKRRCYVIKAAWIKIKLKA